MQHQVYRVIFDSPTLTIDCSQNDSILQILGFPTSAGVTGPFVDQTYYTLGNLEQLNTTASLNIVSDLCCTNSCKMEIQVMLWLQFL